MALSFNVSAIENSAQGECVKESLNFAFTSKDSSEIRISSVRSNQFEKIERRGCCSHHDGVCGCSNGRAVCCDGSYSPSCGCD